MNFCVKEKLAALKRPIVRNKMNMCIEVFKDKDETAPEMSFNMGSNTEFKLISAVAFVAVTVAIACAVHRLCKILHMQR